MVRALSRIHVIFLGLRHVLPGPSPIIVGLHAQSNTLLFVDPTDQEDEVDLRMGMLWKCVKSLCSESQASVDHIPYHRYPRVKLTTSLTDSHVYIFRKSVLDLLSREKTEMTSVKEELLPWLCKLQYQPRRRQKYGPSE